MAFFAFFSGPVDFSTPDFGTLFTDPNLSATGTLREIGMSPASSNFAFAFGGTGFT